MGIRRLALTLVLAAALVGPASDAPAGGISDRPCPTVAGEHTNTCPSGTLGTRYFVRFVEDEDSGCGPGQQTFHVDSGALPPGLTLALDGTLSGTPLQPGRFLFYVEMREPQDDPATCAGKRTQKQFTLRVRKPLSIVTAARLPPRPEVGLRFRWTLRAKGGAGIASWALASGRLPPGLRLYVDGAISGTPRVAGTYRFEARATDTEGRSARWARSLRVASRLRFGTRRLPAASVGRFYTAHLAATGGVARKLWSLIGGELPRGLRLDRARGRLTGTPKDAGTYRVSLEVADGVGARVTRTFMLLVRKGALPSAP